MAARHWFLASVTAVVVIAGGAFATRGLWQPKLDVLLGRPEATASPSTATVEPPQGRRGNGRRGQRQGAGQMPTPVLSPR